MALIRGAEARLKAAVIDRLIESGFVDSSAVLVSELTVANWAHRTDIVLANGRLWGFELKSERDSLERLPAQLEAFSRVFEKLVVVVAEKFEKRAAVLIQEIEGVGLWVASAQGTIVERIRPRVRKLDPEAAISLMTVGEIRGLLRARGTTGLHAKNRFALVSEALSLPCEQLVEGARSAIKKRFKSVHQRFLDAQSACGTLEALPVLTRNPVARNRALSSQSRCDPWALPEVQADHPNIMLAPSGPVIARARR